MWGTLGTYALSAAAADLDNTGWPNIYVANDSTSATYYVNQKDGTFKDQAIEAGVAYSPDGKPQAGMGVSIGDYNRDGLLDIVKTNFAGDTDSLYMNIGDGSFDDRTYQAGLGLNTRLLGWGVSFIDIDNDGWLDILVANGHVYPEVDGTQVDASYAERKYLYRNLRNGQFEDVSLIGGSGITAAVKARGFAVGDFDNDGCLDVVVNCVNDVTATVAQRLHMETQLGQDPAGRQEEQPDGNRRADQGCSPNGNPGADSNTRPGERPGHSSDPDRRGSVEQRVLFGQRPAHPLRAWRGYQNRSCRNPLAFGHCGHAEGSRCESSLRYRRGRQDSQDRPLQVLNGAWAKRSRPKTDQREARRALECQAETSRTRRGNSSPFSVQPHSAGRRNRNRRGC